MLDKLLHIGFAVNSIDDTLKQMEKLGAIEIGRKELPEIGQTSALVEIGGVRYELMQPLGEDGVVPKFIREHGEGFHHISFKTGDIEGFYQMLLDNDVRVFGKKHHDGRKKFFTHPKDTGGVVYEISALED